MSRRRVPLAAVAAGLIVAVAAAPAQARPAAEGNDARPNILVVMTDDMSATDVKLMPNVRRLLAAKGTTFADAVDSFPLCCPARATFITGQYAHNHGVAGNFYPYGWYGMKQRGNTLPAWLAGRRLQDRPDRQVAERLRGTRRPRRGAEGVRHLARPARRLRLRLLQLRHEQRRQAAHLGRRRVRPQAGRVREHRGHPRDRERRRDLRQARELFGPRPYSYWGTEKPSDYSPDVTGEDHRAPRPGRGRVAKAVLHLVVGGGAAPRGRLDDADGPPRARPAPGAAIRRRERGATSCPDRRTSTRPTSPTSRRRSPTPPRR